MRVSLTFPWRIKSHLLIENILKTQTVRPLKVGYGLILPHGSLDLTPLHSREQYCSISQDIYRLRMD